MNQLIKNIQDALKGYKTYIIVAAIIAIATLQQVGIWQVPEVAWTVLAALGLGSMRAGVKKVEELYDEYE